MSGKASKEWRRWRAMMERCYNPKNKDYHNYGGRGIRVCARWHESRNFVLDVGRAPPGMSMDRIDGNGNYEPGNVRWATTAEQAANRRVNLFVTYQGERLPLRVAARLAGVPYARARRRLLAGEPEAAVLGPGGRQKRKVGPAPLIEKNALIARLVELRGQGKTLDEIARELGCYTRRYVGMLISKNGLSRWRGPSRAAP
jgi:hypothetical protein